MAFSGGSWGQNEYLRYILAFICAHLAANKEKIQERCQDFHRIAHVMIENLGKSGFPLHLVLLTCLATLAKMAKDCQIDDSVRESETLELDFCSTRYQQRRSTFVEVKSNPLVELNHDADIPTPEIRVILSFDCLIFRR
jgi:hypothetical protein